MDQRPGKFITQIPRGEGTAKPLLQALALSFPLNNTPDFVYNVASERRDDDDCAAQKAHSAAIGGGSSFASRRNRCARRAGKSFSSSAREKEAAARFPFFLLRARSFSFFSLCTLLLFFKGERSCTRARLRMHMGTSYSPFPADNLGSQSEFSVVNGLYSAVVKIGRQRNFIPVIKPSAVRVVARCDRVNR